MYSVHVHSALETFALRAILDLISFVRSLVLSALVTLAALHISIDDVFFPVSRINTITTPTSDAATAAASTYNSMFNIEYSRNILSIIMTPLNWFTVINESGCVRHIRFKRSETQMKTKKTRLTKIQIDILKRRNSNNLKRIKHSYEGTRKTKKT